MTNTGIDRPLLLALGNDAFVKQIQCDMYRTLPMSHRQFGALGQAGLAELGVSVAISELFHADMDCIEVGQTLHEIGFAGTYLILADDLPNPAIITRELRQLYPGLSFKVCGLAELPSALRELTGCISI
ncbi:hypothetical protein [Aliiroseovarius sp. 2305UL8-7]|uniref:hypothetical protein n=1 Tax=Aliiroseovarius conchicola TaxID=3121637 RepID=UPI0035292E4E